MSEASRNFLREHDSDNAKDSRAEDVSKVPKMFGRRTTTMIVLRAGADRVLHKPIT